MEFLLFIFVALSIVGFALSSKYSLELEKYRDEHAVLKRTLLESIEVINPTGDNGISVRKAYGYTANVIRELMDKFYSDTGSKIQSLEDKALQYERLNALLKRQEAEMERAKSSWGRREAELKEALREAKGGSEERDREYFHKGWERAKAFHTKNDGWIDKEREREKEEQRRRDREREEREQREHEEWEGHKGNHKTSYREKLGAILGISSYNKHFDQWKRARKSYLFKNHPDKNPNSDVQEVAEMNDLWDKVFG